jgi:hypothetical protein
MMRRRGMLLLLAVLLAACSIKQEVKPVMPADLPAARELCVRENPAVRPGFLDAYRRALESKGFAVRMVPATGGITECPLLSTYSASWRWDFTMYMAYAEMAVYRDGQPIGKATYDSLTGGGRVDKKFINADDKVRELVDQLFPR